MNNVLKINKVGIPNSKQLIKICHKLMRNGYDLDSILFEINRDDKFSEYDAKGIRNLVTDIVADYGPYNAIQDIMKCKILNIKNEGFMKFNPVTKHREFIKLVEVCQYCEKSTVIEPRIIPVLLGYNPHITADFYTEGGQQYFNNYVPPDWRAAAHYQRKPISPVFEIPSVYKDFLLNLTGGNEASYIYILQWMALSLRDRNLTYLVTIGSEGVGKGLLGQLMQALHGDLNYCKIDWKQSEVRFNANMEGKTLIYIDELFINAAHHESFLKNLVNETQTVEKKGVDARTYKSFASYYISSNSLEALRLTSDQRRFSLVDLTDTPMRNWPGWTNLNERILELLNAENIAKFASFLMSMRFDENSIKINPFTGESKRLELQQHSLEQWESYVIFELARKRAGDKIELNLLKMLVTEHLNDRKCGISQRKLTKLARMFPHSFTIKQERSDDNTLPTIVTFMPLEDQNVYVKSDYKTKEV